MSQQKIILIAGPTASGKSALAVEMARKTNGTIINADAMQIYEGLPILSAQPSAEERSTAPHELYGVLDPAEASSVGKWLALATDTIDKTITAGRTPILVGGTGLYFRALLGGLSEIPPIPDDVRATTQKLYDALGEEKFREALAKLDPDSAARLARNDRQRLIRAYEVVVHTGKSLGEWHNKNKENGMPAFAGMTNFFVLNPLKQKNSVMPAKAGIPFVIEPHLLLPERETLYATCNQRFLKMIERGAVEEVKAFLKRNLDPTLPTMKTIGVREIGAYLKGVWSLDQAIMKSQQATRNYAKRQMTWFRNQKLGV